MKFPYLSSLENKFLSLIFDRKLNFIPHTKYVKDRCMKAMNLLKIVAHTDWGADVATFAGQIDYGCIVVRVDRIPAVEDNLRELQSELLRYDPNADATQVLMPSTSSNADDVSSYRAPRSLSGICNILLLLELKITYEVKNKVYYRPIHL
jgi:hypothetical protein